MTFDHITQVACLDCQRPKYAEYSVVRKFKYEQVDRNIANIKDIKRKREVQDSTNDASFDPPDEEPIKTKRPRSNIKRLDTESSTAGD
jgi:hypothetical protein